LLASGVPRTANALPWVMAIVAGMVAIVAIVIAVRHPAPSAGPPSESAAPPDLSRMSPREQFIRLNDRVTQAAEHDDSATAQRFWPMAVAAYNNLPATDRDNDLRFHMGWLHLLAGQYPEATALADTIMRDAPDDLLGYYLRETIAGARGDSAAARDARRGFLEHYQAEIKRTDRQEYADHKGMLDGLGARKP
jgi:hypothetical protein